MFFVDRWQEIYDTMRRHKLRTLLTALSVAWGIFMLVLLLGAGEGLRNGTKSRFKDDAINSIWIRPGKTAEPFDGLPPGRKVQLKNADFDAVRANVPGVEHITSRFYVRGEAVRYKDKNSAFEVRACHPGHKYLEQTLMTQGRFLNDLDIAERRKVAVIGRAVKKFLFGDADALGEWIDISGVLYRVIGVFEDVGGEAELEKIYVPVSTAQMAYGGADNVNQIMFTFGNADPDTARRIAKEAKTLLAGRHKFSPTDKRALRVRNNLERVQRFMNIFEIMRIFIWIIGAGTIVAGIVGVSNIMLISVKERTKEFGVRKSLGATPGSIVTMVVQEAILLTAVSGYVGMVVGIAVLEVASAVLPDNEFMQNPNVDLGVVLIATGLLVFFGALAGYFPARRAASVNPVVALRDE